MKTTYLLASLAILLGWVDAATAQQPTLGSPRLAAPESVPEAQLIASEPRSRTCFPLFSHVSRVRFTPVRSALACLFPSPAPIPVVAPATTSDVPTREEIERMVNDGWHSPAEVSAAKIKLDEAQSKSRCAAVRYLATIDCNYYPEAELGLIAALRADRVEAVRHEAVLAMAQCKGLTPRMLEALRLTAQGLDTDGNPPESSERVRTAARNALHRPLPWMGPMPTPTPEEPPTNHPPEWHRVEPHVIHSAWQPNQGWPVPMPLQERWQAETVSTQTVVVARPSFEPWSPRNLIDQIVYWTPWRGHAAPTPTVESITAARMAGLRPLGSEIQLAIPTTPIRYLP